MKPFVSLHVREYRRFWSGQVISLIGTWMHHVAQGWLIYKLTKSPLFLGLGGAALTLPILLFTLFGGIIADKYKKRNVLLFTQSIATLPPIVLGILTVSNVVTVWHVIIIAFFMGTINAIEIPVRQSFLIEMVGKDKLLNAIALHSAAFNGARMLGPLLAGFIIEKGDLSICFFINSISFIPVIMALKSIKIDGFVYTGKSSGILNNLKEGAGFIINNKDISSIFLTIMVFSLFGIPYTQFLPVFAEDILHTGAKGLGLLMSSAGLGAFTGAVVLALRGSMKRKEIYMFLSSLLYPASLLVFSLSRIPTLSYIVLFTAGFSIVTFLANANNTIQLLVSNDLRGRVMSVYSLVFLGMAPLGSTLLGIIASSISTSLTITLSSTVALTAGILFTRAEIRRLKLLFLQSL
ncbi:MAG: MFS transporter [Nitrospirae bacterium]|nr:MFS transporter [Nitrospirota bacterium]